MIYFTSDLHLCHSKPFLYEPRGFTDIDDMNKTIIENWNNLITEDDDVYVLGDLILSDTNKGLELLKQLKGKIHIILGNHDSVERQKAYATLENVVEICWAKVMKIDGYHFFLCHYATMTSTSAIDTYKPLKSCLINLYGHTHQKTNFWSEDNPCIYHVGLDSHNCIPISAQQIIEEIKAKKLQINNKNMTAGE